MNNPDPQFRISLRWKRVRAGVALALIATILAGCFTFGPRAPGKALQVRSQAWAISETAEQIQFGELTFIGGLELESDDRNFGGYSGLALINEGQAILAISDRGHWMAAELMFDQGVLTGLGRVQTGLFPEGGKGAGIGRGDAEALALTEDIAYVPFEGQNSILRFDLGSGYFAQSGTALPVPKEFQGSRRNRGIEALTQTAAGHLFALGERRWPGDDDYFLGWLIEDETKFTPLKFPRTGDFRPSDATYVKGDGIYVLEREHKVGRKASMRISRISDIDRAPQSVVQTAVLLSGTEPMLLDNMEGLAGYSRPDGRTVLFVISDNNFSSFQRTLLLQFLVDPVSKALNTAVPAR